MHSKSSIDKKSHGKHKSKKSSRSGGTSPDKEKTYKQFAGFTSKTIKCMWEQYDRSPDVEVLPDAYQRVAEDATYKIWELVNVSLRISSCTVIDMI